MAKNNKNVSQEETMFYYIETAATPRRRATSKTEIVGFVGGVELRAEKGYRSDSG